MTVLCPRSRIHLKPVLRVLLAGICLTAPVACRAETARGYRQLADEGVARGDYQQAAEDYRAEAAVYSRLGDVNAAKIEEMKAQRWSTTVRLYTTTAPDPTSARRLFTGAKYEPVYGCYLGGYVEADDSLSDAADSRGRRLPQEEAFDDVVGKRLATFFQYVHYGEPFPRWAGEVSRRGIAPHIAFEPNDGLDVVRDDAYLQRFARQAAACKMPVFLRFAAEMNGDWTNYHDNPALYRRKFRLVHDVMARLAPNVVMVWCPNTIPEDTIDEYYPGDDVVDWVGVNFYSVLHHDNNPSVPADFEHPVSMLKYIYAKYSARKPIAICEYGASHRESLAPDVDRSPVAAAKILELFAAIPREFPRVKLIDIFDCDNLRHARAGRRLNDYSVTNSPSVLAAFREAVAPDFYLSSVPGPPNVESGSADLPPTDLPTYVHPITPDLAMTGIARVSAFIKTYEDRPTVVYSVDGHVIRRLVSPGDYSIDLDTSKLSPGKHVLGVRVIDSYGRTAAARQEPIEVVAAKS